MKALLTRMNLLLLRYVWCSDSIIIGNCAVVAVMYIVLLCLPGAFHEPDISVVCTVSVIGML